MAPTVKTEALRVAAAMLGGPRRLRDFLAAPTADVVAWLAGREEPPQAVFLKAIELILDDLDAGGERLARLRRLDPPPGR